MNRIDALSARLRGEGRRARVVNEIGQFVAELASALESSRSVADSSSREGEILDATSAAQ